ncbi:lipoxygenase 1, chloroplastic [Tanacetum coccineum]
MLCSATDRHHPRLQLKTRLTHKVKLYGKQLSVMHPVYKLLDPHMRFTLEINAIARQNLLNADGVIQQCFTPGRCCMETSVAAYKHWRFDIEGLPADLIRSYKATRPSQ